MSPTRCVIALLFLTNIASSLFAQENAAKLPPLPPGAWPAPPGPFSHWLVESKFMVPFDPSSEADSESEESGPRVVRREVVKTKDVVHEQIEDETGRRGETWAVNGRQVVLLPGGKDLQRFVSGHENFRTFGSKAFPGLDWVRRDDYTGVKTVAGRPCAMFESKGRVAAIDLETHLPQAVTSPEEVQIYKFFDPPSSVLRPSGAFAANLAEWQREIERLTIRPPKP